MSKDLVESLILEWSSVVAADPENALDCWDFLRSKGVSENDIWEFSPQIGWDAAQPEPDWL